MIPSALALLADLFATVLKSGRSASPVHSLRQVRQLPRRRLTCHCLKSLDRLG